MRLLPRDTYQSLKTACRSLFARLGKQDAVADDLGVAQSTISYWLDPHREDRFAPVDKILEAEKLAGVPVVTRFMARELGFLLLAMPDVSGDGAYVKELGRLAKETSEAVAAIANAIAIDGDIKPEEIERFRILEEIAEAMERLAAMRELVLTIKGEGADKRPGVSNA